MTRPEHLPNFTSPPLDEVVIGVQFSSPPQYSSLLANDVWGLFKEQFPSVEEHPPLEPSFETFGGSPPQPGVTFRFENTLLRPRLWFVSKEQSHLIQFQQDRFLLNWRRRSDKEHYPRFESISASYEGYIRSLQEYFRNSLNANLSINQAEVSYINLIPLDDYTQVGSWLKFLELGTVNSESFNVNFNEVVNHEGKPFSRLYHEVQSVISKDGKSRALRFLLTFRGKPFGKEISDAMDFIHIGREKIVNRFNELTTSDAHEFWGKLKGWR